MGIKQFELKIYVVEISSAWSEHLTNEDLLDKDCPGTRVRLKCQRVKMDNKPEQNISVEEITWNFDVQPLSTAKTKVRK